MFALDSPGTDGIWDVAVIGAGPAGASAARVAAAAGSRVVVLERATLPRYKTCGGGLIAPSLAALPGGLPIPVKAEASAFTFSLGGRLVRTRRDDTAPIRLVNRDEFDAALVRAATGAGATVCENVLVQRLEQDDQGVRITTLQHGQIAARVVVGADGSAGRAAGHVGVRYAQVDLGLEVEVPVPAAQAGKWDGNVLIDWGRVPGGYAWVFPKGDVLSAGVIGARRRSGQLRAYLAEFLRDQGLTGIEPRVKSGHLTRCRADDSPLYQGRVLVAGDAAGLLEPWTREGISFALRSGTLAGTAAAQAAQAATPAAVAEAMAGYAGQVGTTLAPDMRGGRALLEAFSQRPGLFHAAIISFPPAWRVFRNLVSGDTSFAELTARPAVRASLAVIPRTAWPRRNAIPAA